MPATVTRSDQVVEESEESSAGVEVGVEEARRVADADDAA